LLRGYIQLARNAAMSAVKLAALLGLILVRPPNPAVGIYATSFIGVLLSLLVLVPFVRIHGLPISAYRPQLSLLRQLGTSALEHHALNLALQAPSLLTPLVVTVVLSPELNAYYYLGWIIASFIYIIPTALCTALFAAGSHEPAAIARRLRQTLILATAGTVTANAAVWLLGRPLLTVFGRGYADEVFWVLNVLALGVLPSIIKTHFVAIGQMRKNVRQTAVVIFGVSTAELLAAIVGGTFAGLHGLVMAILLTLCAEAVVLSPRVLRTALTRKAA